MGISAPNKKIFSPPPPPIPCRQPPSPSAPPPPRRPIENRPPPPPFLAPRTPPSPPSSRKKNIQNVHQEGRRTESETGQDPSSAPLLGLNFVISGVVKVARSPVFLVIDSTEITRANLRPTDNRPFLQVPCVDGFQFLQSLPQTP